MSAFGFLAHPELSQEDLNGVSGNYGFLDAVAALKWTHRNIAAFARKIGERIVTDKGFYKRALFLILPVVLQSVINQGVNMMDTIMVGKGPQAGQSAENRICRAEPPALH